MRIYELSARELQLIELAAKVAARAFRLGAAPHTVISNILNLRDPDCLPVMAELTKNDAFDTQVVSRIKQAVGSWAQQGLPKGHPEKQ